MGQCEAEPKVGIVKGETGNPKERSIQGGRAEGKHRNGENQNLKRKTRKEKEKKQANISDPLRAAAFN